MALRDDVLSAVEAKIFDTDTFGNEFLWTDVDDEEHELVGTFEDTARQVNPETGIVETTAPQLTVSTSEIAGMVRGDSIVIGSTTYYVLYYEQDGDGITDVILSKDKP